MKHNLFYSLIAAIFFLCNSCGLGSYPPENEKALVTPDGTKIVQMQTVFFCTQYSSNGNRVRRSGTRTYYIDVYDTNNAKRINSKSFKLKQYSKLESVTNNSFIVSCYDQKKSRNTIEIHDISTGKLRFDEDELKKLNNGLIFQYNQIYQDNNNKTGIIIKADDARFYLLNELNGKASPIEENMSSWISWDDKNFDKKTYVNFDSLNISFDGKTRKKVKIVTKKMIAFNDTINIRGSQRIYERKRTSENSISSKLDYIDPFIPTINGTAYEIAFKNKNLLFADRNWLIISKTKDGQNYEWIFTALDRQNLSEKWTTTLKNPLIDKKSEEIKQLYQKDNTLIIIGTQSINKLDLKSGKWLWNKRLVDNIY